MDQQAIQELLEKREESYYNHFDVNVEEMKEAIVFMFACWSPTGIQFISLMKALENFPDLKLFVFDIDDAKIELYKKVNTLHSHGWGETFFVKSGRLIASLDKYGPDAVPAIIARINLLKTE